jgi:parallel beta-helix repeat protein
MKLRFVVMWSVFVCLSGTAPAFARTIVVDNDFADCPQADFNSIQAAVLAAQPGDKILVCRGDYLEMVSVDATKADLRIQAHAAPGDVILEGGTPAQPFGFHLLNTSGVLVQGFTVQGFGVNIAIEGGSGNMVQKNVTKLAALSGIRVTNSSANVVEQNSSFANQGAGITVTGAGSSNNIIRHNETFQNSQAGIQIVTSGVGNVLFHNESYENPIGIRNVQSAHGSVIENNRVFENVRGIMVGNSTGVTVRNNRSERNDEFGIRIQNSATNNLVEKNEVFQNKQDGIRLESAAAPIPPNIPGPVVGNIVQLNHIRRNGRDGIRVFDQLATGNTFERNVIRESGEHDARDDSVGPATGGTANLWIDNKCETENRPGLCENH